jgi:hypothetical protein
MLPWNGIEGSRKRFSTSGDSLTDAPWPPKTAISGACSTVASPDVYRVIYRVLKKPKRVEVLHIRDGAMRSLKGSDAV